MIGKNIPAYDMTMTWSPALGWHSAVPGKMGKLTRMGFIDITSQVLRSMDTTYKTLGYQPDSFAELQRKRIWAAKFDTRTTAQAFIVGDWFSDLLRKVIPSCLASGVRVILIHTSGRTGNFKPVYPRSEDPSQDLNMAPVYREFACIEDWLALCRTSAQNLEALQADAARLVETAATLGLIPESDGPITGAYQLRQFLPPIETIEQIVEDLAPLYDMELPHPCFVHEYESMAKFNSKNDRRLRPDLAVRSPRVRWVEVTDYTELIICYLQIRWYLQHRIRPTYVWVDAEPAAPYYEDSNSDDEYETEEFCTRRSRRSASDIRPVRMLPTEAYTAGLRGRLRQ